jgi:hypothetical protein
VPTREGERRELPRVRRMDVYSRVVCIRRFITVGFQYIEPQLLSFSFFQIRFLSVDHLSGIIHLFTVGESWLIHIDVIISLLHRLPTLLHWRSLCLLLCRWQLEVLGSRDERNACLRRRWEWSWWQSSRPCNSLRCICTLGWLCRCSECSLPFYCKHLQRCRSNPTR